MSRSILEYIVTAQKIIEEIKKEADEVQATESLKGEADILATMLEKPEITAKDGKSNPIDGVESSKKRNIETILQDTEEEEEEEWFNARTMILDMERRGIKRTKLDTTALGTRNKTRQDAQNIIEKLKETKKTAEQISSKENMKFSDNMKDAVRTRCQICQSAETFVHMRSHVRKRHGMSINEYRQKHGLLLAHVVDAVYHKCGLCSRAVLLDGDTISVHVKGQHHVMHKEYSSKYLTTRNKNYIQDITAKNSNQSILVRKTTEDESNDKSSENLPSESHKKGASHVVSGDDLQVKSSYQDLSAQELLDQLEQLVTNN